MWAERLIRRGMSDEEVQRSDFRCKTNLNRDNWAIFGSAQVAAIANKNQQAKLTEWRFSPRPDLFFKRASEEEGGASCGEMFFSFSVRSSHQRQLSFSHCSIP